ncbi:carbohydrate ABC transporter permease [Paenibacillus elgii]|uniref:Carbohydrate ABC transporter permease n=1 Tax=Paenibacillus elgii TaxID=189691 RepID=A0A2T6FYJ5_9BACL|nr:carbohydrate ABC transporter permease [Paenibacillus elgii]MCM3272506.1 carbohydrate ABC transporter permease [Paenibacillus elgii]NEN84493.1 carbohydrate ABC transporter permease [Paenibacillus elgii]PUA36993.1 carbohydrate ABC transporter permease [Paenibacillus elgii]
MEQALSVKTGSVTGKAGAKWSRGLINVLLTIYALVTLYPLFWLFVSSFKTNEEFHSKPFSLPEVWQWDNFVRAWEVSAMGTSLVNSTIVTVLSLALTLVLGALAAYVLARFDFKLKPLFMGLFLLGMLIPIHSTLVPLFVLMKKVGLLDTYAALVFPYTAFELPLAIFVVAAYLTAIPKEIEEAALIDGTGYWGIFFRMMLPLSLPALSTIAILGFLRFWNDFAFALVFISKPALKTIPLSLSVFATGYATDYKLTMAAMSIAVLPTIIVYLLFQEQIMKGMTAGAVKG